MARIYDNIDLKFTDGLKDLVSTRGVNRVDFCVGYFNLRGWNLVINEVDNLEGDFVDESEDRVFRHCRLLIGMQRPNEELIKQFYSASVPEMVDNQKKLQCKMEMAREFRKQLLLGLPTKQDEATLRRLSTQLKSKKVVVKLYLREPLHAKLYIGYCPSNSMNPINALMGSSNLTYSGLTGNGELNAVFTDEDQNDKFSKWFDKRWNDRTNVDITEELAKVIDESWASERVIPPYYIYLKTAYHLSEEARSGIKEFTLPIEFRRDLFDFQQTAVKIAARYLYSEKRGGAMIGDVVGLGKTITACAIAKIFEMNHSSSTLIICPANLVEMWEKYRNKYDLKADIISMAKPIDIDSSRYYRLIIVDESHNLRNSSGKRYQNIKALIEHLGCKVLLLTATPYNKDYSDLSSQLKLFISEDDDLGIRPENYVASLGGDRAFLQKHSEVHIRSIKAFEKSNSPDDWMDLMKMFLVRRTRTFIKNNYAKSDSRGKYLEFNDGSKSYFPERIPKALKFKTEKGDQYSRLYSNEMIEMMESLLLPRYGLSHYEDTGKTASASQGDKQLLENLSRAGQRMMGFCKSTFFKRMDSSGFSFLLTLYRHILRNAVFIYAIENKLRLPIGDENSLPDEFVEDADINDIFSSDNEYSNENEIDIPTDMKVYMEKARDYYNILLDKNNVRWIDSTYFKRTLKTHLNKDCNLLIEMIQLCGKWNAQGDQKLNMLEDLLNNQHGNEKVIIFTQYSDTANYVYRQLKKRGMKQIGRVTGGMMNPTAVVDRFSPLSNKANISASDELRVLVATDVLSEGQNLQDSHIVVNFDLPWAIIRLIQRAGRVDRIGQEAKEIYCYSFFPADGVEEVINLRGRLNARINENASIVGSDEIFFEGNAQNLRDMYNEKSGSLDEDEDDVDVDLGSQAYQIWKNATDANPELKQIIPNLSNIIYSTKKAASAIEDGVITYAKTHNDFDVLTWYDSNGEIISQSQRRILQALSCSADEPALSPLENHLELVGKAVSGIQSDNMSVSGILGSRFSTRYKIIELMTHFYNQPPSLFLQGERKEQLKMALDAVYNYQLLESAKNLLGRMMRMRNNSNEDIIDTVLELYENDTLCRIDENNNQKEPTIICSMGLKYE